MKTLNEMIQIDIEDSSQSPSCPEPLLIEKWAAMTLQLMKKEGSVAIAIIDEATMQALNQTYRQKPKPTNVLSFPSQLPPELQKDFWGDIAICAQVVEKEANAQKKSIDAHFAHLVVHGILHLLGFDHENESDANKMENEEVRILNTLGFSDPYLTEIIHD